MKYHMLLITVVILILTNGAFAQTTTVAIDPPTQSARIQSTISSDVMIYNVTNLGGFELEVHYDPAIVHADEIQLGEFLGSTGRTLFPVQSEIDNETGIILYAITTLGPNPPGPDGDGLLISITWTTQTEGETPLQLQNVQVTEPNGTPIEIETQDGHLTVYGGADIEVTPENFDINLTEGESTTDTLYLRNIGLAPLTYDLSDSVAWLSYTPISGTIDTNQVEEINLTFDAANLTEGIYQTNLTVASNDPTEPIVIVPITLTVDALPEIPDVCNITPDNLAHTLMAGEVETVEDMLFFANCGTGALYYSLIDSVDWLMPDPADGEIPAGGNTEISISFDGSQLTAGVYHTHLVIESNDPDTPMVNVPVMLTVVTSDEPDLCELIPDSLAYTLIEGEMETVENMLYFANCGTAPLTYALTDTAQWLRYEPVADTIAAGGNANIMVTFDATELTTGTYETTLWLESNDPAEPMIAIPVVLTVTALPTPDICQIAPEMLNYSLIEGDSMRVEEMLSFVNCGTAMLEYTLEDTAGWFACSPVTGTVAIGDTARITAIFDAASLIEGMYETTLWIISNDPQESMIGIPVVLQVLPMPAIDVYLPPQASAMPDDTTHLTITIPEDVTGREIRSYDLVITYDPQILTAIEVTTEGTMSENWSITPNLTTPGQITIIAFHANPMEGSGTLINLVFDVRGELGSETDLVFAHFEFNEGDPASIPHDGHFMVPFNVYAPADAYGLAGSHIHLPIMLTEDVTGSEIVTFRFVLGFDPDILTPTGVTIEGTLTEDWTVTPQLNVPGQMTVVGFNAVEMTGSGTMIYLDFEVVGEAESQTELTFLDFAFNQGILASLTHDGLFTVGAPGYMIAGQTIYRSTNAPAIPDAQVTLTNGDPMITASNTDGYFMFEELEQENYTLSASKDGDVNHSIGGFDAARIAMFVAGTWDFDEYELIAADVTDNGSISGYDASKIAQYAAGLQHGSLTGSWTFEPANYTYTPLLEDQLEQDFIGILYGEVTGNWTSGIPQAAASRTEISKQDIRQAENVILTIGKVIRPVGSEIIVPVVMEHNTDQAIHSIQFVLEYDHAELALLDHHTTESINMVVNDAEDGLHVVLYAAQPIDAGEVCQLRFTLLQETTTSELRFQTAWINDDQPQTKDMLISIAQIPASYQLWQNVPNPFNPTTTISFALPMEAMVAVNVYDVSGKLIKTLIEQTKPAGYHSVTWNGTDQAGQAVPSGVYFYRLTTNHFQDIKRMILLK